MFSLNNNEVLNDTDVIKLAAKGKAFTDVNVTVVAELMKNQQHTSPLDPTGNIEIGQDNEGWPMIFTIGTDKKFYLMKLNSTVTGGYETINLSDGLGSDQEAVTFAMTQDSKGKISVTLAMARKSGGETTIYGVTRLSNNYAETDWKNFSALASKIEGVNAQFKVEQMLMNISDDGKAPVSVVAGNLDGYKYYYLLNGAGTARKYEFPEDVKKHPDGLKDISIGYAFGQTGIFFIYDNGASQTLACTTLANSMKGSLSFDYSAGNAEIPEPFRRLTYNCISTPTGSKTKAVSICSDIFVGSPTGVYCFKNASKKQCILVTDKIKDVHELTVRQDKDAIVVWASTAGNKLYYIYGKKEEKGEKYVWNDPILFKEDVLHIAPVRNTEREGNELYLVTQDKSIQHYWQDSGSTLWRQQVINVADQADIIEFNSYTTHLHFEDDKGKALIAEKVKITASEWVYVTINGFIYSLDKGSSAEISTDIMGNVTVITMTDDIACPVYHLTADWMDKTLNIYPNGKITKGLANIKSAADLKGAKTEDGKLVLSGSTLDDDTLTAVAGNISQLADKGNQLKNGSRNDSGRYTFTAVENKGVLHTGKLKLADLPDNFMLSYGDNNTLAFMPPPGGIFDDIISFAGDALHYLSEFVKSSIKAIRDGLIVLENGIQFVLKKIGEGLQFVLAIGDKILNIVLDTLGAVFKALNWVLKLIGIDLEKILEWLGKLIGWTDILETSDKVCDMINSGFDLVSATSGVIGDKLSSMFREIELKIAGEDIVNKLGGTGEQNQTNGRGGPIQNPAANLLNYHLMHGKQAPPDEPKNLQSSANDSITEKIEKVFTELLKSEVFTGEKAVSMISDLLSNISTDSIGETITRVLQILAVTALEEVKHGLLAIIGIMDLLVVIFKAELNTPFNIPILTGLLKLVMGGREFTILRVISIMIALPLRLFYRIFTGDSFPQEKMQSADQAWVVEALRKSSTGSKSITATNENYTAPADEKVKQSETWVPMFYGICRVAETIFGTFDLFNFLTYGPIIPPTEAANARLCSAGKIVASGLALSMVSKNFFDHSVNSTTDAGKIIDEITWAEWCVFTFAFIKVGLAMIGSYKPAAKSITRPISVAVSLLSITLLSVEFGSLSADNKNRSNDLRFTSNLFLSLYKMIGDFPFPVRNPLAAGGICAGFALLSTTHIALVAARSITDREDNYIFKII